MRSTNPVEQGPFKLLMDLDIFRGSATPLSKSQEQQYKELSGVLHHISDADHGDFTRALVKWACEMNSEAAARALCGLRLANERRRIVALIEEYPNEPERNSGSDVKPEPKNNLPLVLLGTRDPAEIQLLIKCTQFKRPDGTRTAEDVVFCTNAIEALEKTESPLVQKSLLTTLASENEPISTRAYSALTLYCSEETRHRLSELLELPKRDAIKSIARMQGKGAFAALKESLFDSSRYDRFFEYAQSLTKRLRKPQ